MPMADTFRQSMGLSTDTSSSRHNKTTSWKPGDTPADMHYPRSIVIKVQVPAIAGTTGDMLVYTKKRDFICTIRYEDNGNGYTHLADVVRTKGAGGLKAYFAAELRSKDELLVKVSELLAEQPF
jgi:hypothetical protein